MAAYIIARVKVNDPEEYEEYKKLTPLTLAAYGGRFLVRSPTALLLEGSGESKRVVVLEFPDMASAKAWWDSEEYAKAKAIRQRSANADIILVDGFNG